MRITRRYLAAAGALVFAATALRGHAESAEDAAVRKAIDSLVKAMTALTSKRLKRWCPIS